MSYFTDRFDGRVVKLLKNGAVGFMPSDTIYGLSCRALDKQAVKSLHMLKDRDQNKPFIVLISNLKMLNLLSISYNEVITTEKYWPGPLTLICPAPKAPNWLQLGAETLALRIPDNQELRKLIQQVGPIVSTSANIQGGKPAATAREARRFFGDKLNFYVDKGEIKSMPSTIIKVENGKLIVVREGAHSLEGPTLGKEL